MMTTTIPLRLLVRDDPIGCIRGSRLAVRRSPEQVR
jgi:hypothetical protein